MPSTSEVAPGIIQIKVPIPRNALGFTLTYLLKGPNGHILIDTGVPLVQARDVLLPALKALMDPSDLETVLVTHSHRDHSGLVSEVKSWAPEATVAMHALDWKDMGFHRAMFSRAQEDHSRARRQFEKWLKMNGYPEDKIDVAIDRRSRREKEEEENPWREDKEILPMKEPDLLLQGGETITNGAFSLNVVHTPGHSPGHICFHEPNRRIMFTGDHVLPGITPNVSFRPGSGKSPLDDYLASLSKVEKYDVALVCPAHERTFDDLPKRAGELKHHHDMRLNAVLAAMRDGRQTAYHIAERVPWDVGAWAHMDEGLRRAAVGETLSHLEYLVLKGQVREMRENGVVRFEAANS